MVGIGDGVLQAPVFDVRFVLADFGVTIHFNAEVITRFLPIHFTIGYAEEILHANFVTARNLKEGNTGWSILLFTHPIGDGIISWTPGKVTNTLNLKWKK